MTSLSACALRSAAFALLAAAPVALGSPAWAQNQGTQEPGRLESFKSDVGGAFGRIFGGSERMGDGPRDGRGRGGEEAPSTVVAQMSASELTMRLDRMENQIRQLTGMVEQLQFRNQQLEQQVRRGQEDADYRFQELGGKGGGAARPQRPPAAQPAPQQQPSGPPPGPGRRSDVYDPNENPAAPGAPQVLGALPPGRPSAPLASPPPIIDEEPQVGTPGGRQSGAPLDLSTLSDNAANDPDIDPARVPPSVIAAAPSGEPRMIPGALPPPPPRNPNATGAQPQIAMVPTQTPRDELALGQGLVQRKEYAAAEDSLRAFLKKYPNDKLVSDAHYWLGESLYQRQRYRDAAESFLNISTKFESSGKAPDALVRLGQSLAALGEREAACATLGEVGRKYPRASAGVKQSVEREQKRAKC
jgi:tol-pal system protein YbgF